MEIEFSCPQCGWHYVDPLEVLGAQAAHEIRCERCARYFVVSVLECQSCESDEIRTWKERPSDRQVLRLDCRSCGASLLAPKDEEPEVW